MKILIVEDEALTAMSMQVILEDHGYEVVGAADNLASALELSITHAPQLALVDIRLSGGDSGLDVAQALTAAGVAVIFATGNCPGDAAASLALGCLHKPIGEDQLVRGVAVGAATLQNLSPQQMPGGMHLFEGYAPAARGA